MRKSLTVLGSVLILTLGGVWIAHATTASEPGTITACAKKPGGALRFSTTGNCRTDETKLAWNQQGVPGEDGDDGVSGYQLVTQGAMVGPGFTGFSIECPAGKRIISAGLRAISPDSGNEANASAIEVRNGGPNAAGTGWNFAVANTFDLDREILMRAVCATVTP